MNNEPPKNISFAEFELDTARRALRREGKPLALNAKTFDLLAFLVENNGRTVSKDEILEAVWAGQFVEEANLSVQISALRKALGDRKDVPRFFVTVPGVGYRFVADVKNKSDDEIVIEKHKFGRLVVDEEIEAGDSPEAKKLAARKPPNRTVIFVGAAVAAVLLLIGFVGFKYFSGAAKTRINSVAVLSFVNETGDQNAEYLGDGLAESVIYSLSALPDLRVMSRHSAFRFKANETDAKIVGRELNVETVLTGRVAQTGENLSVSAELVSTADNSVIWGERFTRKASDVGKLQTDIAQSIAQKLRVKLAGEKRLATTQTGNAEAYRLYLLGRFHLNKLTDEGFWKARDYFQQAIDLDPNYAHAYAGLAEAYNRLSGYNALSSNEGYPKARQAAQKALELDDRLAEAHATLGAVKHFYDWDFAGAEKDFRRALEINPNSADAHQLYSYHLTAMRRFDESMAEMRRARELDPLALEKNTGVGEIFYFQRQYDRALEQYQKVFEIEPNAGILHWAIGNVYVQKKMYPQAIAAYQKAIPLSGSSPDESASLAFAYALSGNRQDALRIVEDLENRAKRQFISPTVLAVVYGGLGERDRAFELLNKAYNERDFLLTLLNAEPIFDPLRDDPRFAELVRRVGL